VRKIGVAIAVRLDQASLEGAHMCTELKRQAFITLKRGLEGLRNVEIRVSFKGAMERGEVGRRRVIETIVGLMGIFRGLEIVVSEGDRRMDQEMRNILETRRERMRSGIWEDIRVLGTRHLARQLDEEA